jgi:AraC family transcriptional regulator
MSKPDTTRDYGRRIERVVAFIGAHLDDPLDLERLAAVACFSPYHFHRIYRALAGETTADTLRHLRLHRAAGEIVNERTPIAAIARRAGYGSVAAFSRAFRTAYQATPAAYRKHGRLIAVGPQVEVEGDVRLVDLAGGRHAVFVHKGPYAELESAYRWAYKQWLPQSGEEPADRPCFEEYLNDCRALPPAEWLTAICLPLAERGSSTIAS